MPLIKCSECGKKISDKAEKCVNCGTPISEMSKKNIEADEELNSFRNYMKRDSKIKKGIIIIFVFIIGGIVLSNVIKTIKENNEMSESEKRWMEESKGYFSFGDYSIKMDGKGNATLCVNDSCTYPNYKYDYPNGYIYSDNNNFVSKCHWISISGLRSYNVFGLSCEKSNGEKLLIPEIVNGEYVKTIEH